MYISRHILPINQSIHHPIDQHSFSLDSLVPTLPNLTTASLPNQRSTVDQILALSNAE